MTAELDAMKLNVLVLIHRLYQTLAALNARPIT